LTEHKGHWSEVSVLRLKWPEGEGHFGPRFGVTNHRTGEIHDAYSALGVAVLIAEIITENNAFRRTSGDEDNARTEDVFETAIRKGEIQGRDRKRALDLTREDIPTIPPLIPRRLPK
jgi:hypothetical protein